MLWQRLLAVGRDGAYIGSVSCMTLLRQVPEMTGFRGLVGDLPDMVVVRVS